MIGGYQYEKGHQRDHEDVQERGNQAKL